MKVNKNLTASCTITLFGAGTLASFALYTAATTTTAMVATAFFGMLSVAGSLAAFTAWFDPDSESASDYLKNTVKHCQVTIPLCVQAVASRLMEIAVKSTAEGMGDKAYSKISGKKVKAVRVRG